MNNSSLAKQVLRAMKKICRTVRAHAERYERALEKRWSETDLSRKEAEVILRCMKRVFAVLPEAMRQAHKRIIGERLAANADKILSLYEGDIHVIVRGKAGADGEFGNSFFVAETVSGFILDHELRRDAPPGDAKWLQERYPKIKEASGDRLCAAARDLGFDSAGSRRMLDEQVAFNCLCPRDSRKMQRRLREDEAFIHAQKRRAQSEGRIGILKIGFFQGVPGAKGFRNWELQLDWAVLAHNLWVLARCAWACEEQVAAEAA